MHQKGILPVLAATLLLDMVGFGMLIPIIPSLFTDATSPSFVLEGYSLSAQYFIAGLITALFGLLQFVGAPILGELSDMYGRKKLLALGVGMLAISNFVFAFGVAVKSLVILLGSRIFAGLAGANFSIAQATIADVTKPEDRSKNFGIIGAAIGLGFILGPLLGGWIAGASGNPALPFFCAGILGVINLCSLAFFLKETHIVNEETSRPSLMKAFQNIKEAWSDTIVRPVYFASFFVMLGFSFFTSFISVYLVDRFNFTESNTGMYFGIVGVWIVIAQAVVVRMVGKRYTERTILLASLPILALTIAIHPFVPGIKYLYFAMPFMAISFGLITTNIPALVSKRAGDRQGAALGINGSLQALTQGIAPIAAGLLAGYFGLGASFIIGSLLVIVAYFFVQTAFAKETIEA
jgi:MFS transporter, DHA1 family, tetracycline resistance protein